MKQENQKNCGYPDNVDKMSEMKELKTAGEQQAVDKLSEMEEPSNIVASEEQPEIEMLSEDEESKETEEQPEIESLLEDEESDETEEPLESEDLEILEEMSEEELQAAIEQLAAILRESETVVFFGGAGVSTASGIPDFRSSDGVYNIKMRRHYSPEEAVSRSYFLYHTEDFYSFYRENLVYLEAKPNACHESLVQLEQMGKLIAVITQNIDGLHQAAGSKTVYEMHGSVHRNYCTTCRAAYPAQYVMEAEGVPRCKKCGGIVKPDVVLYEESIDQKVYEKAVDAIWEADTLIIGGTSLVVYPAAGLVRFFGGKHLVLINKTVTSADKDADLVIHADIAEVMKRAVSLI